MYLFQGPFSTFKYKTETGCDWTGIKFSLGNTENSHAHCFFHTLITFFTRSLLFSHAHCSFHTLIIVKSLVELLIHQECIVRSSVSNKYFKNFAFYPNCGSITLKHRSFGSSYFLRTVETSLKFTRYKIY